MIRTNNFECAMFKESGKFSSFFTHFKKVQIPIRAFPNATQVLDILM